MKDILLRFKKYPFDFVRRTLYKSIIGPLKYGRGDDYDAAGYWRTRFLKYGQSLRGAGDEGLPEEDNEKMYAKAAKIFTDLCRKEAIDFPRVNVLEIGCGTGFYTRLLHNSGLKNYVGVDITDVLFPELRKTFPQFRFIRKDITSDEIEGNFDLIVMIDVIEHIVRESKLSVAMRNVESCLLTNGILMVAPISDIIKRHFFYVRSWSLEDIKQRFSECIFRELVPFRDNCILTIKKS